MLSLLSREAVALQPLVIDAAVAAGVSRFIPSEFGIDTRTVRDQKIGPKVRSKVETTKYLVELSAKHPDFTWTGLSVGLLFDWVSASSVYMS